MIQVTNLSKSFRVHKKEPGLKGSFRGLFDRKFEVKHALKSVSLEVKAGEIVGLVGANGAGKTTLLKLLAGIVHPTSGEAKVLDYTPWERDNRLRRQVALIMGQKAQLWWDLPAARLFFTVARNISNPARRVPRKSRSPDENSRRRKATQHSDSQTQSWRTDEDGIDRGTSASTQGSFPR